MTFGERLRRRRTQLGMSQPHLAAITGVSVRTIRALEHGQVARPQRATVIRLATAVGLDEQDDAGTAGLRVGVLGPLSVTRDGTQVQVRAAKQRRLLGLLALRAGQVVPAAAIAEALWDGQVPQSWLNLVHTYVARLRGLLGRKEAIVALRGGYRLEPDELDLRRFEEHLAAGLELRRSGDPAGAAEPLGRALELWRGALLEDLPDAVRDDPAAAAVERSRVVAAEAYAEALLARGEPAAAVSVLDELVGREPLHEGLHARLMLALASDGRQAEALRVYEGIRGRLREEIGLDPGAELREAQLAVLRQEVPAPRPRGGPAELPADLAAFTGRSAEVAHLSELLVTEEPGPVAVSAIAGAGGMGKSALAVHVAHRVAGFFPDGQLYVDLRGLEPHEALARLLRSLGVAGSAIPASAEEAAARYRSLTDGRRMLIVLDNARDGATVRELLPGSATCRVLVTSRRILTSLDGAFHYHLDVLPEAEGVELLSRLAGHGRVTAERQAAAEVVRLCGRLPLAICIAAGRLTGRPALSIAALARRLESARLNELESDDRAVRATFLVSYQDLLRRHGGGAARLFRLLGLVDGHDIRAEVAAALAFVPLEAAEELLDHLVESRLVEPHGCGRYRMHELLRLFAAERAAEEEPAGVLAHAVRRALDFQLATARNATRVIAPAQEWRLDLGPAAGTGLELPGMREVTDWVDGEAANLVAAVAQAAGLGEDELAVALAAALFIPFYERGQWHDLLTIGESALAAAERAGVAELLAVAHNDLGQALSRMGRQDDAIGHLTTALELSRSLGHRRPESHHLIGLASTHRRMGRFEEATRYYREALEIDREQGDRISESFNLANLGMTYTGMGRFAEAIEVLERASSGVADVRARTNVLDCLGATYRLAGLPGKAIACLEEAIELDRGAGTYWEAERLWLLGLAHHAAGDGARARRRWRESAAILDALGLLTAAERAEISGSASVPASPEVIARML